MLDLEKYADSFFNWQEYLYNIEFPNDDNGDVIFNFSFPPEVYDVINFNTQVAEKYFSEVKVTREREPIWSIDFDGQVGHYPTPVKVEIKMPYNTFLVLTRKQKHKV
jgi:hypothetical protein